MSEKKEMGSGNGTAKVGGTRDKQDAGRWKVVVSIEFENRVARGDGGLMMYFWSFLALFGKFKSKNLHLNVFVQFFSVFLFLNPF